MKIEVPCNIGDKVYFFDLINVGYVDEDIIVGEGKVDQILIREGFQVVTVKTNREYNELFSFDEFGKKAFTSKDKANKALEGFKKTLKR